MFLEISQNCARVSILCLRPATLLKKRLWHRSFPVNFAKFLRTPFLQNTSGRLLLQRLLPSLLYRRQIFAVTVRNNPQKDIKNFWFCILFFTSFPCSKHFMWHYNFLCHVKLVHVISLQVLYKQHRVSYINRILHCTLLVRRSYRKSIESDEWKDPEMFLFIVVSWLGSRSRVRNRLLVKD